MRHFHHIQAIIASNETVEKIVGDLTQRANAELDNAKDLFNRGMQELGLENAAEKAAEGLQCVAAAEALVASLASLERFDQMTLEQKLSTISDILMNLAQVLESIAALLLFFPFGAGAATALFNVAKVLKTAGKVFKVLSLIAKMCAAKSFLDVLVATGKFLAATSGEKTNKAKAEAHGASGANEIKSSNAVADQAAVHATESRAASAKIGSLAV